MQALTSMQRMQYNEAIMKNSNQQITVRGLDATTKIALINKANREGISLNRYVLKTLQQSAGLDEDEIRYQALKKFLNAHHMTKEDKKAFDEALLWADEASKRKQKRDEA